MDEDLRKALNEVMFEPNQSDQTLPSVGSVDATLDQAMFFRHEFEAHRSPDDHVRLYVTSQGSRIEVWLNSQKVELSQDDK